MEEISKARRRKRRLRGGREEEQKPKPPPVWGGLVGGRYQPLTQRDCERIHQTALDLLEKVGMAQAIPSMVEVITAAGGFLKEDGRLCYPRSLVEDILARAPRQFVMPGQQPKHDMEVGGKRVYCGTGGAAPMILDFETGKYRETRLVDLYDIARLVDTLDNIHYFWRTVVARDMPTSLDLDLNTAYACMQGTTKHIGVSYVKGDHVRKAVAMFDLVVADYGGFRKRPFCSISCCHVVPPLRFAEESSDALDAAVRAGMPITLLSAAQAGATSPAALAGTIVQAIAEVLAGLVFCVLVDPNCRANLGTWPFVSDLRTGAMCSGSAELGLLVAGCAQMAAFYDLPGSVAAGMSDSKVPDAQAGAEKAYTIALAANAGSSLIMESAGMHASLLGTSLESYVIDNDILGAVQRTVRGIEVTDETLSFEVIRDVVNGEGHFLGNQQTIERMESDYFYPKMGDRNSPGNWEEQGSSNIRQRARAHTRQLLAEHYPTHIDPKLDAKIRENFHIFLPRDDMKRGNRRW